MREMQERVEMWLNLQPNFLNLIGRNVSRAKEKRFINTEEYIHNENTLFIRLEIK
jgi:hypothetical protein